MKNFGFYETTREDIEKAYILAFKNNLKGITVYRNNSRTFQPMNLEVKKEPEIQIKPVQEETYAPTGKIKKVS